MSTFSVNLKREREERGITQSELSCKSGVSRQTINAIEGGTRSPTEETMQKLSDVLECTLAYMLRSSEDSSIERSVDDLPTHGNQGENGDMYAVGQIIKQKRIRYGITQAELSRRSGVSQSAISSIESMIETKAPSTVTIKMIAGALGCTVAELMGETDKGRESMITNDEMQFVLSLRRHPEYMDAIAKMLDINIGKSGTAPV